MSVTIKDIAKIANVSHTTVSRALNDSPLINENTKRKIKEIAKQLNYSPNYNAKSLVLDKSYNIGLFFSSLDQGTSAHFFHEVVKEVNQVIKDKYNLIVRGIDDHKDYNSIHNKNFDGLIVMSQSMNDNSFIYNILEKQIPMVVLNREIEGASTIQILSDDRDGAYKATEYLIQCGHEKIGVIEGKTNFRSTQARIEGVIEAFINNHIPINRNYFMSGDYSFQSGFLAMKEILKLQDQPTAVFCFNDDMAIGAIKAVSENGLKVPDDISIIGFDDNIFSVFSLPALTTVKRRMGEISGKGAQKLLKLINNERLEPETLYVDTELIIRDSVINHPPPMHR